MAMALIGPFATADNCKKGLEYCGSTLMTKGNYRDQINDALEGNSLSSTNNTVVMNTLFTCLGGDNGDIEVIEFCQQGCTDGGSGKNDYCSGQSATSSSPSIVSTATSSTSTTSSTAETLSISVTGSTSEPTSQPTSQDSNNNDSNGGSGTPVGAIVGGVVGGVAAIGLIAIAAFLFGRYKNKSQNQQPDPSISHGSASPAGLYHDLKPLAPAPQSTIVHEAPTHDDVRHEMP
ncbi:hypothetical protein B0T10DRAFT_564508 [Thelonectria olida]|uniref:Uncharacterized protein n=1 Tax=Thelonectria olida TaxID=1576542 RepID=A0A9P9APF1_9HYPO|nr:hypothetical protein B0T10DRAFT_564508 [Thelonectria olida]